MATRSYSSPIRDAQVEQTRALLMERAHALLVEGGPGALTLPKLAQAAGVSVPTVYRHFPTVDDLLYAFLEWLRPQLGLTPDRFAARSPEAIAAMPLENYASYDAHAAVLRPLMDSRGFNKVRVASIRDRARNARKHIRPSAPGWSDAELEAMIGTVWVLNAPQVWRWLRDTWGLENEEAARASSWAMQTLLEGLARGPLPAPRKRSAKPARRRKR